MTQKTDTIHSLTEKEYRLATQIHDLKHAEKNHRMIGMLLILAAVFLVTLFLFLVLKSGKVTISIAAGVLVAAACILLAKRYLDASKTAGNNLVQVYHSMNDEMKEKMNEASEKVPSSYQQHLYADPVYAAFESKKRNILIILCILFAIGILITAIVHFWTGISILAVSFVVLVSWYGKVTIAENAHLNKGEAENKTMEKKKAKR